MSYRMGKRILALIAACALTLIFCAQALADQAVTAYTRSDNAKVYDAEGNAQGTLPANTKLTVTGVKGEICRVERDGKTAYMKKSDLSVSEPQANSQGEQSAASPASTAQSVAAYVSKDGAKLCNAEGKVKDSLALNAKVTVTGVKDGVCRVEWDGKTGYMKKADLSDAPVAAASGASEKASQAQKSATAYVNREGAKLYNANGDVEGTLNINAEVKVTAVKGDACKVVSGGKTGYMRKGDLSAQKTQLETAPAAESAAPAGGSTVTPAKGTAVEKDWWTSDIQTIFARGVVAKITDVETGLSWQEKRTGGTNHADCQPLTAADTAAMKKAYGGKWSWNRRAVFVTIDGVNYAASINGMPHGSGSIKDNDFDGHHCIHFTNSRTHGSNKVCPLHQAAIKKAASTTLK